MRVILGIGPQLFRLYKEIPNLEYRFYSNVIIIGFPSAAVYLVDDFRQAFHPILGNPKVFGNWKSRDLVYCKIRYSMFTNHILHEMWCFGSIQAETAAWVPDIDKRQQIRDQVILFMQFHILEAGYFQQKLIESHEVAHHGHAFELLLLLYSCDDGIHIIMILS